MAAAKPITIVGGGLAGLTLGIGLRQRGVPVTIWEAGNYPRHRVCGEFISGQGPSVLQRLGLRDVFENAGAFHAKTVTFIAGKNFSPARRLPEPALCLSRYDMDALLAKKFQELGGELKVGERWAEAGVQASACGALKRKLQPEGIVRASGRRARPTENGYRWFGLKAHVRDVELTADLEMHVSESSYVGVNRINNGEVNVCGLFRAPANSGKEFTEANKRNEGALLPSFPSVAKKTPLELLCGAEGSTLRERLEDSIFDESSFCSIAGISLKPQTTAEREDCCIGDAVTMIPPVTGNGMSMAFESAELAIGPLTAFSRNELSWPETRANIARACDAAFARRLAWARLLQWLMFSPILRTSFGSVPLRSDLLWRILFTNTR